MDSAQVIAQLSARAADQWGLITAAQAASEGIAAHAMTRLVESGVVHRFPGEVYQLSGSADQENLDEKAAWLGLVPARYARDREPLEPDGGVLSHRSAALLHGIADRQPTPIDIIVPAHRGDTTRTIRFHHAELDSTDVTLVAGLLPVTTAERTIVDLAAEQVQVGYLGGVIAEAFQRDLVNVDTLAERIAAYAPWYGGPSEGRELIASLRRKAHWPPLESDEKASPPASQSAATARLFLQEKTTFAGELVKVFV